MAGCHSEGNLAGSAVAAEFVKGLNNNEDNEMARAGHSFGCAGRMRGRHAGFVKAVKTVVPGIQKHGTV